MRIIGCTLAPPFQPYLPTEILAAKQAETSSLFHAGFQPPLLPTCFLAGCAPGKSSFIQTESRDVFGNATQRVLPEVLLTPRTFKFNPVKHRLVGTLQPSADLSSPTDLFLWRIFTSFFLTGAELALPHLCLQGFSQPHRKLTIA